jgi:hypothetical protein
VAGRNIATSKRELETRCHDAVIIAVVESQGPGVSFLSREP